MSRSHGQIHIDDARLPAVPLIVAHDDGKFSVELCQAPVTVWLCGTPDQLREFASRLGETVWFDPLFRRAGGVMVVIVCVVAIVAAAHGVWWLAGICLLGALLLGAAEYVDDEREAVSRRRVRAELRRHEEQRR